MFHGLVHEMVLEHSSLSFPRQAEVHPETAAWIPLPYSACKPFLGSCAQNYFPASFVLI